MSAYKQQRASHPSGICHHGKDFDMNARQRGYFMITVVLSAASAIVGLLMLIFSNGTYDKAVGLTIAVAGPATIWFVYGCAYPTFKG